MDVPKFVIILILFAAAGCKQAPRGEEDLLFLTNMPGTAIKEGDLVEMNAVERSTDGNVLWRSADEGRTALITRGPTSFKGDLHSALGLLSEGDSATIRIDSMKLIYDVKIIRVIAKASIDSFMRARMAQLQAQELARLATFKKTIKQPSGLQYTIRKTGVGHPARTGDTVLLKYTSTLLSGRIIDTALSKPRSYLAGLNSAIAGLEEAMQLLPAQTKATLIIPSALAFGKDGYEGIQPYTPLIYDLEIVRIGRATGKRPTEPGAPLPDFHATNIANNILVQKEDVFRGPCVFIFFSTDCGHCKQLIRDLEKRPQTRVYLISPDSREAIAAATASLAHKPNITILHDEQKVCLGRFQVSHFPATYQYDHQRLVKYLK